MQFFVQFFLAANWAASARSGGSILSCYSFVKHNTKLQIGIELFCYKHLEQLSIGEPFEELLQIFIARRISHKLFWLQQIFINHI